MAKLLKRFRVLFTLTDGRKVYSTKEGKIALMPKSQCEEIGAKARSWFAYTPDLKQFGFAAQLPAPTAGIEHVDYEPATSPLTPGAFVLGGGLAADVQQRAATKAD